MKKRKKTNVMAVRVEVIRRSPEASKLENMKNWSDTMNPRNKDTTGVYVNKGCGVSSCLEPKKNHYWTNMDSNAYFQTYLEK